MFNISDYLQKFKNIHVEKSQFKDFIVELVKRELKSEINRDNIDLRKGVIYLKISPIQKNELFMKKQQILNEFNKTFPTIPVSDIR